MTISMRWAARLLAVLFALFLSLFALDVFGEYDSLGLTLVALFMHLIPSMLVLAAVAVEWRWPVIGAVAFMLLGITTVFFFRTYEEAITMIIISAPLFFISALFYWDTHRRSYFSERPAT